MRLLLDFIYSRPPSGANTPKKTGTEDESSKNDATARVADNDWSADWMTNYWAPTQ